MRYVSLFSGIEAASVAWEGLGWEPVAYSEIDPFPCAVLAERFPEVPNLGDVKEIKWKRYRGQVDLAVGGSPCQSFSIAGKREGLDGASGLMWEYVRCVREVRPRWLLWENVPGALSSSRGEDFRCLLDSLGDLGYGLAWRVLDAQFFGVAQRRRRLFVVGCLGAEPPVQILFEPGSLSGDFETGRKERARIAARSGGGSYAAGFCNPAVKAGSIGYRIEQHPTLRAGSNLASTRAVLRVSSGQDSPGIKQTTYACESVYCVGDATSKAAVDEDIAGTLKVGGSPGYISAKTATQGRKYIVRRLTPTECERLQGFPDGWTKVPYRGKPAEECPDGPRYKALGNSMAVPVMRWIGRRIAMEEQVVGK
ncbi:DNA cytosine methyltransferase [Slackia exigua]|uniref:DNA cytosine methyltransferase n=1 Tax=Slackia exigua TaxID=84109 RepID=UPI003B9EFA97